MSSISVGTPIPIGNISNFVKSGDEILICSDFEGVLPEAQFNNFKSIFDEDLDVTFQAKKIIYLGDMFDNTGCAGSPFLNEKNYCALRTLKYLVDNPERSRYVVGNRDINKIKLVPLLQFKDGKQWWKMDKEEENKDSFISIVSNLIITNFGLDVSISPETSASLEPKKPIWNVMTMENYRPFWSPKSETDLLKWFDEGNNIKPMNTLYDRFNRIFGLDTTEGTMSAANTLTGLPNELFGSKVTTVINTIRDKIMKNETVTLIDAQNKLLSENENEIRSAIVFTVFMRMLDKDLYINESQNPVSFSDNQLGYIDGYLWKYLTSAAPALYAINGNDVLLFSHGGITNEFVKSENKNIGLIKLKAIRNSTETTNISNIPQTPQTLQSWRDVLNTRKNNVKNTKNIPMTDEALKAKQQKEHDNDKDITGNIDSYNSQYFMVITDCFKTFIQTPPSQEINTDLMILLSISAAAENNPIIYASGYTTSNFSPIQPRLPDNSVLTSSDGKKIFNFCGHASSGNGYGLKKIRENMFFINTDLIATLFKKGAGTCDKEIYNSNYLWLTIKFDKTTNDFNVQLEGNNTLKTEKFIEQPKLGEETLNVVDNSLEAILSNQSIQADKIPYTLVLIDDKCKAIEELGSNVILKVKYKGQLNDKFFKNKYDGKQFVVFNGEVDYKGTKYDLYSYLKITDGKAKNILMLNKSEAVPHREYMFEEGHYGGYRKKASNKKSIKKNRKNKTKGKLLKKNSTRNNKLKSKKH